MKKLGTLFVIVGILFVLSLDSGCSSEQLPTPDHLRAEAEALEIKAEAFEAYAALEKGDILICNGTLAVRWNSPEDQGLGCRALSESLHRCDIFTYEDMFAGSARIVKFGTPQWAELIRASL